MFLLDTNIVSELRRPRPAQSVVGWVRSKPQDQLFISVVTIAEIARGIAAHRDPAQRKSLQFWLDDFVRPWLYERILLVSEPIAETTGRIAGERDAAGRPLGFPDAAIAATAIENSFTLVTRNIKDFANLPVPIMNPWDIQGSPS